MEICTNQYNAHEARLERIAAGKFDVQARHALRMFSAVLDVIEEDEGRRTPHELFEAAFLQLEELPPRERIVRDLGL